MTDVEVDLKEALKPYIEEDYPPDVGESFEGNGSWFEVIAVEEIDYGRWELYSMYVIKDPNGELWGVTTKEGLTELQVTDGWFVDGPYPVVEYQVQVTSYRRV